MLVERELLSLDLSAHPLDFYPLDNGVTKMKDLPSIATGAMDEINQKRFVKPSYIDLPKQSGSIMAFNLHFLTRRGQ